MYSSAGVIWALGVGAQPGAGKYLVKLWWNKPLRFCQERPWLSIEHSAAASAEAWRAFSMKGHRCSGWVYSSLFYGIMRIYSLLLISRKYFAFMAECLVPEKHQSSPCFWPQQSERNVPCPSNTGFGVGCAQRQPQPSPRLKHSQYLQC